MSWRETLLELRAQGFDVLDWLSAVEQEGSVRITACLLSSADPDLVQLVTTPAPVASVSDLFLSADWHERETAEMFGVEFEGRADCLPLLLEPGSRPPLRRETPLPARLQPWPGAVDPAKPKRTQQPPGTPWQ